MPKEKELSKQDSIKYVKELLKTNMTNVKKKFQPGRIIFFKYNAKNQEDTFDKTPLVMVLRVSKGYMLGINFHWLPMPHRVVLIKHILKINKRNIKNNVPLEFSYQQMKPFLIKFGYAPVIRLYIRKRISDNGVLIPDDQLMNVARTKTETFTSGKVSSEQLYKLALKKSKNYRSTRKRRQ